MDEVEDLTRQLNEMAAEREGASKPRPTIHELEKLLADAEAGQIEIQSNGEVRTSDARTEEAATLRAAAKALTVSPEKLNKAVEAILLGSGQRRGNSTSYINLNQAREIARAAATALGLKISPEA